jgi:hypothetical protein
MEMNKLIDWLIDWLITLKMEETGSSETMWRTKLHGVISQKTVILIHLLLFP